MPRPIGFDAPRVEFLTSPAPSETPPKAPPSRYQPHVTDARPLRDEITLRAKREAEPLYKVVEVVDERTLRLESGRQIQLLGIEVETERAEAAKEYLREFVCGKQIYIRLDEGTMQSEAVYILLKNKIFINRKMIESGLARTGKGNYKWREKFEKAAVESLP